MDWTSAPPKPAEFTENRLIDGILSTDFPVGSNLPGERELAAQLGVTRPTLREALQRLARDGWVEIRHGKPTRVRDYWQEGNLGVLGAIARRSDNLPPDFVPNLLRIRYLLAPAYTSEAITHAPDAISKILNTYPLVEESPEAFAAFDWQLHHQLTVSSGNPVFTLILNGFSELYQQMGELYFTRQTARQHSQSYYAGLKQAAQARDARKAAEITERVMVESLALWLRGENPG
jgi:GntR family negative regulator for fad regulon and positive regulator of fabA